MMRIVLPLLAGLCLVWCAAIWLIVTAVVTPAFPHSFYDPECCSGQDCAPVQDDTVTEGPNGYRLPDGNLLPYGSPRIRFSPDQHYHWCHAGSMTYCLYIPGRGT